VLILQVNSTRNYVQLAYDSHDRSGLQRHYSDASIVDWHEKNEDGPHFPRYNGRGNSFRVTKRGAFNANYSMEFNAMGGARRLLVLLTGKQQMWLRLHCYLCGAWMEVRTNCTHRAMTYSGGAPTMYIPLGAGNADGEERRCALWTGGETEETLQREEEHRLEEEEPVVEESIESAEPIEEPSSEESPEQVAPCNCEPEPRVEQLHSDIVVLIRQDGVLVGSMSGGRPEMVPVESTHVSGTVDGHGLSVGRWWKLKAADMLSESSEEPVASLAEPLDPIEEPVETSQQVEEPAVNTFWE
jgi:hypothetical protein